MKVSEAILRCLKSYGVDYIFGIPAGTVSPIFDSMNDIDICPIVMKNEAGAAYSASRYASLTKKLSVCIGAGGVGVNNMVNGIADAMRSKVPMLVISGFIHRWQIGKGAIQELDTQNIMKPITKYSYTILEENKVLEELNKAINLALTPPYGPVHLCIPVDVQSCFLNDDVQVKSIDTGCKPVKPDFIALDKAAEVINNEKYGFILAGKGCRGLTEQLMQLSEHLQWPVLTTTEGMGVIPTNYKMCLGSYGFSSTDAADDFVEKGPATCVLVLGSSLGEAATKNFNKVLVNNRKVIHVDWDINELGKVFDTDVKVCCDLKDAIPYLIKNTNESSVLFEKTALNGPYINNHTGVSLRLLLENLHNMMPSNTCYVSDLGEYMNFEFKYLTIQDGGDFEVNLNYGAMGSGIAGAIGAYLADPSRPVLAIAGDGSFFMNGMEILTAKEYGLPIIFMVINNSMLGYVEHGHQFLFGRVVNGFKQQRVSICDMVSSLGIKSMQVNSIEEADGIPEFIKGLEEPCFIEIVTDGSEAAPILGRLQALKKVKV